MTASDTISRLDSALALARQGFRVFPLAAGTKVPPKNFAWKEEATTDPARIREWWNADPNYNIGVATGRGTIVVDVDTKDGPDGLASLDMLDTLGMATSYRVRTPSGGVHVYLRAERAHANRVKTIPDLPGLDLRGENGYVVGPGSTADGKAYSSLGGEIEPAGDWLEDILAKAAPTHKLSDDKRPLVELDLPENIEQAVRYLVDRAPEATEGAGGDQVTYSVAARCRGYGLSPEMTFEIMAEHWNDSKASPPWDVDDLKAKVDNAYKYATGAWGGETAAGEFADLDTSDLDIGVSPFVKREIEKAAERAKGQRRKLLDYTAMQAMPDPEWLIDGVLQRRKSALMFGKSNAFKSFLAIDLALHIATGRPWHSKPVKAGRVIYVASEGQEGIAKSRVPGWYDHYGVPIDQRGNLFLWPDAIEVDQPKRVAELATEIADVGGAELVVLDIFGSMSAGSEIEDTTARAWVTGLRNMLAANTAVLTVAHTGWQDSSRARMHSHTWGSFDTRLIVEGDKEKLTSVLSVERHKDADSRGKWGFRLEPTCGTLVPVFEEGVAERARQDRLSGQQAKALEVFNKALAEHGELKHGDGWPMCHVVAVEHWRAACKGGALLTDTPNKDAARSAFNRNRKDLIGRGYLKERDGFIWSPQDDP